MDDRATARNEEPPGTRLWARGLVLARRFSRLPAYLQEQIGLQQERLVLWLAVSYAGGIGLYFILPAEPLPILAALPCAVFAGLLCTPLRRLGLVRGFLWLALMFALGFAAAQWRTHSVHTPILSRETGPAELRGRIAAIEDMGEEKGAGARLIVDRLSIEKIPPEQTPGKIRLRVRVDDDYRVGQEIHVLANLHPPSPPVMPGAFDFQRYLYFQGIGGVGYVYKTLSAPSGSLAARGSDFMLAVESMRRAIDLIVARALPAQQSGTAAALLTGRQTTITDADKIAMQNAGLAHLLAVSGLNIGLFASAVFFMVRLLLAAVPYLALHWPIKKIAALAGFAGACFYLAMAGFVIPAQRSAIMVGIALVAVLFDRSPFSLRLLGLAAFAVLLVSPESLITASFQMSFGAVGALIVFYEWAQEPLTRLYRQAGFWQRAGLYLLGVCITTVIGTLASTPLSLTHFQQIPLYGLLGNLIAVPVMAFIVMPAAVAALFAMPFGLETAPLWLMGQGIAITLAVAHEIASWPGAILRLQAWPPDLLAPFFAGMIVLCLWRGGLRWLGTLPVIYALYAAFAWQAPDIVVMDRFDNVMIRRPDGVLAFDTLRRGRFGIHSLERLYGLPEGAADKWPKEGYDAAEFLACDVKGCRATLKGHRISVLRKPDIYQAERSWADIVLSARPLKGFKDVAGAAGDEDERTPLVVDKFSAIGGQGLAIWLQEGKPPLIRSVRQDRGARPWVQTSPRSQGRYNRSAAGDAGAAPIRKAEKTQ